MPTANLARGTTFKIYLPRYNTKAALLPDKGPDTPSQKGCETVLLVEGRAVDPENDHQDAQAARVHCCGGFHTGRGYPLAKEYAGDIHLVMTDVVMPEMNGRDLAKNILSLYPSVKCLFMSGYTANVIAHHGVLDEGVNFIQKPFSIKELTLKLREVLDRN